MLRHSLQSVCQEHDYHLLESDLNPDNLRCVLSLRPQQTPSTVIQKLKGSLSRDLSKPVSHTPPLFERGYLARTVGRVCIETVKRYLDSQAEHHNYLTRGRIPVVNYRPKQKTELRAAHGWFDLSHHLVFATRWRRAVFGSTLGRELSDYWPKVAAKRGFAIDRMTVLPDHVHLLVRTPPKLSVETCALSLLNNAQHWIVQDNRVDIVSAGVDQLWQPSAYAGTCGEVSTALMKRFLSRPT